MASSKLWIEFAQRSSSASVDEPDSTIIRTLTTEEHALALIASGAIREVSVLRAALERTWDALARGAGLEDTIERLLAVLSTGVYLPWALLQVGPTSVGGSRPVRSVECDAPPLFFARRGGLLLPPVLEEEAYGHLVRRCNFDVYNGDHLAMVSEHYIRARGGARPWSWRDVAVSIRRLIETRCDAEQLADALMHSYQRFASDGRRAEENAKSHAASILAMFVRPLRSVTVWSGPPSQRALDPEMLRRFMAEEDMRVICGDTTAEIAARLLGAKLVLEPPPEEGWREVPPTSRLIAADGSALVALVAEGVVTMRAACERLVVAQRPRELAGRQDGASRLARLLLTADQVRFLVGLAVNPAQMAPNGAPLRVTLIKKLADDLQARGKIVSVTSF